MLVDLAQYGLPHEPTPSEALAHGADLVTFSGDKLLGGPQAGLIVGRADLVAAIKRNPLRRTLRVDKMTIAALSAVLALYADRERLRRDDCRSLDAPHAIRRARFARSQNACCRLIADGVRSRGDRAASLTVKVRSAAALFRRARSQAWDSPCIRVRDAERVATLHAIATSFRGLPIPVIGRIQDDTFILDLRCLTDEHTFAAQLSELRYSRRATKKFETPDGRTRQWTDHDAARELWNISSPPPRCSLTGCGVRFRTPITRPERSLVTLQTFTMQFPSKTTSSDASALWYGGCTANCAA